MRAPASTATARWLLAPRRKKWQCPTPRSKPPSSISPRNPLESPDSAEAGDDLPCEQLDRAHDPVVRDAGGLHETDEVIETRLLVALHLAHAMLDVADDDHVLAVEIVERALVLHHLDDDGILLGDHVAVGRALDLIGGILALHAATAWIDDTPR